MLRVEKIEALPVHPEPGAGQAVMLMHVGATPQSQVLVLGKSAVQRNRQRTGSPITRIQIYLQMVRWLVRDL